MKKWRLANISWSLIFAAGIVFLSMRQVDGAGVDQTPEVKMVSLFVLGIIFLIFFAIQLVWGHFFKKRRV